MRCLEVAVNGERFCVAGADDVRMFCASVMYDRPDDTTDRDKTSLKVRGLSGDVETDYYWGEEAFALRAGDVVTIRVVDDVVVDKPIPVPTPLSSRNVRRALKRARARLPESHAGLDLSTLDQKRRVTLKSLLFWCALSVLALALWFFGS